MAGSLRYLVRTAKLTTFQTITEYLAAPTACSVAKFQVPVRNINVKISPSVNELDVSKLPDYESSNEEWKYVERLIPLKLVPVPKKFDGTGPSGWVPAREERKTHPYFVRRTKNYMMPVYLKISYRGSRHITIIKFVDGDIWKLEKDVRQFLQENIGPLKYTRLGSRVNEMSRQVHFRGDYVSLVKKWMEIKGF